MSGVTFEEFCRMKKRKRKSEVGLSGHMMEEKARKKEAKRKKREGEAEELERKREKRIAKNFSNDREGVLPPDEKATLDRRQQVRNKIMERESSIWVDGTRTDEVQETEREKEKRLKKEKKVKKKTEKKKKKQEEKDAKKRKKLFKKFTKQEQKAKLDPTFWKNADVKSFVKEDPSAAPEAAKFLNALEVDPKGFAKRLNHHKHMLKASSRAPPPMTTAQKVELKEVEAGARKMSAQAVADLSEKFC